MQYLLSQEEMDAINAERAALNKIPVGGRDLILGLTNVCQMVADTMVPTMGTAYQSSRSRPTDPVGCINTPGKNEGGYCDRCAVRGICPQPKRFGK